MNNREYIHNLFCRIYYTHLELVKYILNNDNEAPEFIKILCYKYIEEWNKDAKSMAYNKPSEKIILQINKYYNL